MLGHLAALTTHCRRCQAAYTQGETLEEIQANLREAAEGWLVSAHDEAMDRHSTEEGAA